MASLWIGTGTYLLIGIAFALGHLVSDIQREERARALRKAIQFEVDERPLWFAVGLLSVARVLVWPLHLLLHEN